MTRTTYNAELLRERMKSLVHRYEGVRPTARVLEIDPSYVTRLCNGDKCEPNDALLRKLKLVRVVSYVDEAIRKPSDSEQNQGTEQVNKK